MPYLIPTPHGEYAEFQKRVQDAGYPWFSVAHLQPFGRGDGDHCPDGLGRHQHQSHNTHLIVKGQLKIDLLGKKHQTVFLDADSRDMSQKETMVPPKLSYIGTAGPKGAIFIEAHSILSPTTAKRLAIRKHIIWYDDGSGETPAEWIAKQQVRELREVNARARFDRVNLQGLYDRRASF